MVQYAKVIAISFLYREWFLIIHTICVSLVIQYDMEHIDDSFNIHLLLNFTLTFIAPKMFILIFSWKKNKKRPNTNEKENHLNGNEKHRHTKYNGNMIRFVLILYIFYRGKMENKTLWYVIGHNDYARRPKWVTFFRAFVLF